MRIFAGVPRGEEYWIMVSHTGNIRHCAQPRSAFGPYWAVFTGQHSAGRHSGTHPSQHVTEIRMLYSGISTKRHQYFWMVQRWATRLIVNLWDIIKFLGTTTLNTQSTHKLQGDLVEVFKMFMGLENIDHATFITHSQSVLCRHPCKLYKIYLRCDIMIHSCFYSQMFVALDGLLCADVKKPLTHCHHDINY